MQRFINACRVCSHQLPALAVPLQDDSPSTRSFNTAQWYLWRFSQSTEDELVPFAMAERLVQAARQRGPVTFLPIQGCSYNGIFEASWYQHNATLLHHIILFFTTTRKGRSGLAEHTNNPLRGMEFETVAKADFT
jgi:fermentation-respiration switch protein FrsA (DUF1100 family)